MIGFKGRQFKVVEGDELVVPLPPRVEIGDRYEVSDVMMIGSRDRTVIGRSTVPGATVQLQVEEIARAPKVLVFKKKRRKGYRRTRGHRQPIMALSVRSIEVDEEAAMGGAQAPQVGDRPDPMSAGDLPPLPTDSEGNVLPRQPGPQEVLIKQEAEEEAGSDAVEVEEGARA